MSNKNFEIRNSTAEFLTFVATGKEDGIQVLYKDETVWATQKAMATWFDCSTDNIGLHLKNIFKSGELIEDSVTEKISATESSVNAYPKPADSKYCTFFLYCRTTIITTHNNAFLLDSSHLSVTLQSTYSASTSITKECLHCKYRKNFHISPY